MSSTISVLAEDGTPLAHRIWRAESAKATVIAWSGVMSHSLWLAPIAERLAERGITFVGADRRGSGPNPTARGDAPSAEVLLDDARRIVRHHASPSSFLLGWCWGATLALNVMRSVDARGLILIAPGLWPTERVDRAAKEADAAAKSAREDEAVVGMPIAEEMFTRGPMLESFIRADELRLTVVTPRFRKAMGRLAITAAASLRKIEAPTLLILADADEATDSDAAARAFLDRATVVRLPGPHGLMFERPEELAEAIASFIEEHR
jgi:alpha-beta hydrolase superfamily lysophospholipase